MGTELVVLDAKNNNLSYHDIYYKLKVEKKFKKLQKKQYKKECESIFEELIQFNGHDIFDLRDSYITKYIYLKNGLKIKSRLINFFKDKISGFDFEGYISIFDIEKIVVTDDTEKEMSKRQKEYDKKSLFFKMFNERPDYFGGFQH